MASSSSVKLNWRKFGLFDKATLTENICETLENDPVALRADGGNLFLGDAVGNFYQMDRSLKILSKQKIFRGQIFDISGIVYVSGGAPATGTRRQFVFTVGDDSPKSEDGIVYTVKVFIVSEMSRPVQSFSVAGLPKGAALTCFSVLSDGSRIALGFTTGTILMYEGEFLKESTGRPPIPQILLQKHASLCSGLHFCESSSSPAYKTTGDRSVNLFAIFDTPEVAAKDHRRGPGEGGVIVFDASGTLAPNILDDLGAPLGCTSFMKGTSELVLGRQEGVLSYSVDGRGGAVAFESSKHRVSSIGRYLMVSFVDDKTGRMSVTVYDLRNKFIAASTTLPHGETVRLFSSDSGAAFVLTTSGCILQFLEKDTNSKLEVLVKKNLYNLAISLAAEELCDAAEIVKLYQKYAEHLYEKEEFDGAVEQFCYTIGFVQPSYVIRKFLDPQRLVNLIAYLDKIHEKGLATRDISMLLLTSLIKLSDLEKILHFTELDIPLSLPATGADADSPRVEGVSVAPRLDREGDRSLGSGGGGSDGVGPPQPTRTPFNPDDAISTLISAGIPGIALRVAWRNLRHDAFIDIHTTEKDTFNMCISSALSDYRDTTLLADEVDATGSYPSVEVAVSYLAALTYHIPLSDILHLVVKYGQRIMKKRPDLLTALLVKFCKGDFDLFRPASTRLRPGSIPVGCIACEPLLRLFTGLDAHMRKFLEGVFLTKTSEGVYSVNPTANGGNTMGSTVTIAFLDAYLKEYVNYKEQLAAAVQVGTSEEAKAVKKSLRLIEDLILSFLELNDVAPDDMKVMLLLYTNGFKQGQVYLLEKQSSPEALLQKYMEIGDNKGLFRLLRKEGRRKSEIAPIILTHFVKSAGTSALKSAPSSPVRKPLRGKDSDDEDDDDEVDEEEDADSLDGEGKWDDVLEALSIIERDASLSPMEVINILAQNPQLPLSVCFDYTRRYLQATQSEAATTAGLVDNMRSVVSHAEDELEALKKKEELYKFRGVDRRQKQPKAKTPTHEDDDDDDDDDDEEEEDEEDDNDMSDAANIADAEKKEMTVERKKWLAIKGLLIERSTDHEGFFTELEQSSSGDGFATIAAYFGKTVVM